MQHHFNIMASFNDLKFSDLLISTDCMVFRFLEGQSNPITALPSEYHNEALRVKACLEEEKLTKGNEFFFMHEGTPYRITVINTIDGSGYFLRKLQLPIPKLDVLGFAPAFLETIKLLGKKRGLILIGGATGSGKSTTIYSLLTHYVSMYGDVAISVEDPPEVPIQGVYGEAGKGIWYQLNAQDVGGYENAMISAMRYNPRYIFIGEIRSSKTAKEAIRAAVNGHLVVSTIHGSSVQGAIYALQQIASAEGELDLVRSIIADGLLCVIHQEMHFTPSGTRKVHANMLCNDGSPAIATKIRSGKLELLSNEIEAQKIMLSKGQPLVS